MLIIAVALSYLFGKQTDDNSGLGGSQATTTSLTNEEKRIIEEAFVQSAVDGAKNVQKSSLEKKFKSAPENTLSEEEKQNIENNFNSNINSN